MLNQEVLALALLVILDELQTLRNARYGTDRAVTPAMAELRAVVTEALNPPTIASEEKE